MFSPNDSPVALASGGSLCEGFTLSIHTLAVSKSAMPKHNWNSVRLLCRDFFRVHADFFRGDSVAQREHWLNFTDYLCRTGQITQAQRDNWSCPF